MKNLIMVMFLGLTLSQVGLVLVQYDIEVIGAVVAFVGVNLVILSTALALKKRGKNENNRCL